MEKRSETHAWRCCNNGKDCSLWCVLIERWIKTFLTAWSGFWSFRWNKLRIKINPKKAEPSSESRKAMIRLKYCLAFEAAEICHEIFTNYFFWKVVDTHKKNSTILLRNWKRWKCFSLFFSSFSHISCDCCILPFQKSVGLWAPT